MRVFGQLSDLGLPRLVGSLQWASSKTISTGLWCVSFWHLGDERFQSSFVGAGSGTNLSTGNVHRLPATASANSAASCL